MPFLPEAQSEGSPDQLSFVIRARGTFSDVMTSEEEQMVQLDRGPLVNFRMLDVNVEQSVLRERLMANLSGGFGLLAALLSMLLMLEHQHAFAAIQLENPLGFCESDTGECPCSR
jgi:hypothetical protein